MHPLQRPEPRLRSRQDLLHERFRAQARRTPAGLAVETGHGRYLTYAELDAASDAVAAALCGRGIGGGDRVGLYLGRGAEAIVAVLGVLKSGAAYVPVDTRQPAARSAHQLDDALVAGVLASAALVADVPSGLPCASVDLEGRVAGGPDRWESRDVAGVPARQGPAADDLAYVIFTSGSTGRPKGTAVPHRGLVALAEDQMVRWRCRPGSRVLQFAPLSFDASVTEILVALLSGATLCLAAQDDLMPGEDLYTTLRSRRIGAVKAPPAVLAATPSDDLPDLRLVVSGGGACRRDVVDRWAEGREFRNAFGTTETSVCNAMTGPLRPGAAIVLGEPVGASRLHVLDGAGLPVGSDEVGELHIGGDAVAAGYWRRPDLTSDRFVDDPFGEYGDRLYRTGDLVRREQGGDLVYVGRADHQMKVRGHRVEPAEVESALLDRDDIADAAAVARDDRITVFAVPAAGATIDPESIRSDLGGRLPGYMVPASVIQLERLPLGPRGKPDRDVMHEMADAGDRSSVVPAAPGSTPVEVVWGEVLGVDVADHDQNFFHLGGDSLQAADLVARLGEVLGVHVSLRTLLRAPRLGEFVDAVAALTDEVAA